MNKCKKKGRSPVGPRPFFLLPYSLIPHRCSAIEEGIYSSQTAVVVNLLHVPGVPSAVHTYSAALLSIYSSPLR